MYFSIYFPGRSFSRVILNQKNPKVCKYQLFEIDYHFRAMKMNKSNNQIQKRDPIRKKLR